MELADVLVFHPRVDDLGSPRYRRRDRRRRRHRATEIQEDIHAADPAREAHAVETSEQRMIEGHVAVYGETLRDVGSELFGQFDDAGIGPCAGDLVSDIDDRLFGLDQQPRGLIDDVCARREIGIHAETVLRIDPVGDLRLAQQIQRIADVDRPAWRRVCHLERPACHLRDAPGVLDLPPPFGELDHRCEPVVHLLKLLTAPEFVRWTVRKDGDGRAILPGVIEVVHRVGHRDTGDEQCRRPVAREFVPVRHARRLTFL